MHNWTIGDDILDIRDLAERLFELHEDNDDPELRDILDAFFDDEGIDPENPDYHNGPTLIHDDYFVTYAEELAEDIGAIGSEQGSWPLYCIDWKRAARDLKVDYTSVDIGGHTYWLR